jgi:hypothetical protein
MDDRVRFAREAALDLSDVRGRAADIGDHRVGDARQIGRAPHGIRRAGGEAVDWEPSCHRRLGDGPVVLGDEERCSDAAFGDRPREGGDRVACQIGKGRVEQRGVLAFEQADAAKFMRTGDRNVLAEFRGQDLGGTALLAWVDRREDRGDRDRAEPGRLDLPRGGGQRGFVERHDRTSIVVMAAFDLPDAALGERRHVGGPVAEGRQRRADRPADAHRGDPGQLTALHHRVDEMGGPDHHSVDVARAVRMGAQSRERVEDAGSDIFRGRRLDGAAYRPAIDQDGVRVGSPDIDSDPSHDANTDLKSRS